MKTYLSSLTALLVLLVSCGGPKETAISPSDIDLNKNSLLYKVSGNGLDKPSYIFGTIHLIEADKFKIKPEVLDALDDCAEIAFELKLNDLSMMSKMINGLKMPEGTALSSYLNDEEFKQLSTYIADSLDSDISQYDGMKPMYLYQQIALKGIKGEVKSYEIELMELALEREMSIAGLESVEEQLALFDNIPMREQLDWIMEGISDYTAAADEWGRLVLAYETEDIELLHEIIVEDSPEFSKYKAPLLYDRNLNWVSTLENMMSKKSTFVAVGSGHLGGEKGVINLLRKAGYQVVPV